MNGNQEARMTEQWVDGFVSAVKSAGYDESAVPRILKIARLSEARRVNPDVFDAEFEKQAGLGSWLMNIAIALGIGWGGYQLLKKLYAAYAGKPAPDPAQAGNTGGAGGGATTTTSVRNPPSWERGHAVNGGAGASSDAGAAPSTSATTPAQKPKSYVAKDILKSPTARSPVTVVDSNGRQIANTDRHVPPMPDPAKPGNMYKYMAPANPSLIITR